MTLISLPVYEGFNAIAIWPGYHPVSHGSFHFEYILFEPLLKEFSYFGLVSTSLIANPVATGQGITVPLYAGSMYAAYPARSMEEVRISNIYSNLFIYNLINRWVLS